MRDDRGSCRRRNDTRYIRFIITSCARDAASASDKQFAELAGAVAQLVGRHAELVQQRQLQVGQRRVFGITR